MERKTLDSPEKGRPSWGKVPKLGTSSSSPSTHVRVLGQVLPPPTEVLRAPSSQLRSGSAAKAKDSSGRAAKPSFEVCLSPFGVPLRRAQSLIFRGWKS